MKNMQSTVHYPNPNSRATDLEDAMASATGLSVTLRYSGHIGCQFESHYK